MKAQTAARIAVCLFFAALTAIGLLCTPDYGLPCDETTEQIILQENMLEYTLKLFGEENDAAQWYLSRDITPAAQSIERDHGQSVYYPVAWLLPLQADRPDEVMTLWHGYTWLWFMLGVAAVYGFCRQTGLSRPISCAGMLLVYLCPRFFAEGHYNSKDVILLTLFLCILWQGVRFLKKPCFVRGMLLSLFGALAANTKIVGIFGWGVMCLCAVALVTASRRWNLRMVLTALWTGTTFVLFYTALTPAMWSDPLGYIKHLLLNASGFTRWPGVVVFRGMVFDHSVNPLPRYYLPWMMMVTLPLYVPPLAAVGQVTLLLRAARQKTRLLSDPTTLSLAAATLMWFVPLAAAMVMRPLVYNGWRHFYFVYAGVAVLAAHGLGACTRQARRFGGDYGMHRIFAAGLCLFFIWTGRDIARNHPYQYAYYNRLAHETAQTDMELDYWVVSTTNALRRLGECERDGRLPLTVGTRDDMGWVGISRSYGVLDDDLRAAITVSYDADAPYLFYNTTYAQIYGVAPPEGYHELFTLRSYDLAICTVYEKDLT